MSSEHSLDDADRYRQRLYDVREATELGFAEKLRRFLAIGREYLSVENGHVEKVTDGGETHEVVASVTENGDIFPTGASLDASTTYCRRTVQSASPLALSNAGEEGFASDPAYREHGLECYLGAPIRVRGDTYGTVCFLSHEARDAEFSAVERSFVELVARMIGQELERRAYERELDANERARRDVTSKYEAVLQAAPNAILLVDAADRTIVEANDAATDLTGYDRATLRGREVTDIHPPGQVEKYARVFRNGPDGTPTRSELPDGTQMTVQRRDGTEVPVEISASLVELDGAEYVLGILRDISDRLDRERELRVKDRAIDEASVGITIADANSDNEIVYANEEFQRLTGYDTAEIEGRNCRMLQGPETDRDAVAELAAAIAANEPVRTELLNYRDDGTPFWNEVSVTPVEDDAGEVTHFVGFQRDVTERKRRERIITVLNRVLRHNLRNRMNALTGRADLLAEELDGDAAEHAREMAATAWDLIDLSEDARQLETAIREDTTPEPCDVVPLVEEAVADVQSSAPDGGRTLDIDLDVPVEATALATQTVSDAVRELVANAVEHAGDDPDIEVTVTETDGGDLEIAVADDGPGMPEAERDLLRGGEESPLEHGSGLGLWLVNWLVTDLGGTVDATVDDGTIVAVRLRTPDSAVNPASKAARRAALGHD